MYMYNPYALEIAMAERAALAREAAYYAALHAELRRRRRHRLGRRERSIR